MQKHWGVMRSENSGDTWTEVSGNLSTDLGIVTDVHAHEPETLYVVPITSDAQHLVMDGKLRVYRSRTGGNEWEALSKGLPQENCYVNVLRDAMAVDTMDACGVYFGTTGELSFERSGPVTQRTILDHVTQKRRDLIRFFVCEEDLSHEAPDPLLPDAVAKGIEPYLVVGAIAGG